jgi:hypothetical protein
MWKVVLEGMLNVLEGSKTMLPWIAVWLVFYIADRRKEKNKPKLGEKEYVIKSDKLFFWIMLVGFLFFSYCLCMSIVDSQLDWGTGGGFGAFTLFTLMGVLKTSLWRVRVDGMQIEFRSTFGRTRVYSFSDVTKGLYKKGGELRIYAGDKRIFTFEELIDSSPFEFQMLELGIPMEELHGMTTDAHVLRPQMVYFIISGASFAGWAVMGILLRTQGARISLLDLAFWGPAVICLLLFLDFLFDKAEVKGNTLYRRRFLKGTREIPFHQISGVRMKKNLFRENLIIYENGKKAAVIWIRNEPIELFRGKLAKEKIPYIKGKR